MRYPLANYSFPWQSLPWRPSALTLLLMSLLLISAMVPFVAIARGAVHFGELRVEADDRRDPVMVLGGPIVINGDTHAPLLLVGGNIHHAGVARDDLVVVAGDLHLAARSVVQGNVVAVGGRIFRDEAAVVQGNVAGSEFLWAGAELRRSGDPGALLAARIRLGLLGMIAAVLVGLAATTFVPWPIILAATSASEQPLRSGLVGATGLACLPLLIMPLALSLVGLPLALFLALGLFGAWVVGLAAFGLLIGRRLLALWTTESSLTTATMVGLAIIGATQSIPLVGGVILVVAGGVGAGALALGVVAGEFGQPSLTTGHLVDPVVGD